MKSIFVALLLIGLSSCATERTTNENGKIVKNKTKVEPILVGDWKLSGFDMGREIPAEKKELFETMKQEMIDNSRLSYKADGTYSYSDLMEGEVKSGTGTYFVEGDQLTTTSSEGVATTVNIVSLTDSEVTFSLEDRGTTMKMTYIRR